MITPGPQKRIPKPVAATQAVRLRRAAPTHLRGVQEHFAQYLTESDVVALQRVFGKLAGPEYE